MRCGLLSESSQRLFFQRILEAGLIMWKRFDLLPDKVKTNIYSYDGEKLDPLG